MQFPRTTPVFVFVGQKGGVGKTVTATNMAAAIAHETPTRPQRNVLVIDVDPQGNTERALGAEEGGEGSTVLTIADLLLAYRDGFSAEIPDYPLARTAVPGVTLAAGGNALDEIDDELGAAGRATVREWMKGVIELLAPQYDAIVIDTPAAIDALTMGGILSADLVICVAKPEDSFVTDALDKVDSYLLDLADQGQAPPMVMVANEAIPSRTQYKLVNEIITADEFPSLRAGTDAIGAITGKPSPWIAQIPATVHLRNGARNGEPLVIGRRAGTEAGRKLKEMAETAMTIATTRTEVAR